ncbi:MULTISPECIES: deoxyribodipyrimidine photo-lyase [Dickeya]|uniref:Deoxyribodipyrimidine photo-lyase n=1 Tax=Dickeya aquatica TaxID=1401087 RepID=A0A375ACX1_9GAMM|nr:MULTISPECIES: deoxyribodipyrimidine photo-lyase [Dickeya]SLM63837.1 Deoxyribodipyrimidine photolyase [Dickeya aquatica]
MTTHLVWFRHDLRLTDNLALSAACENPTAQVEAVFIATPGQWARHAMSPRQAAFLQANLGMLQQALQEKGIPLHYHQCDDFAGTVEWLAAFCHERQVTTLFYNRQYEWNECQRDRQLEQALSGRTECRGFDDSLLLPPGSVVTGSGEMYKVFTPFRAAFIRRLLQSEVRSLPAPAARQQGECPIQPLTPFSYPTQCLARPEAFTPQGADFPAGEQAALQRLRQFCREQVAQYHQRRDLPALNATSQLSPYLALGVISPRQCINRLRMEHPEVLTQPESGAFSWFNELVWREFYRHLLVFSPALCRHQPFIGWTRHIAWREAPQELLAWQRGETGYPIVDAAMRQLNATGWMHNRLRMICASFLVKDLLIDWRAGERYFMEQLLDGDLAANNGGWQWAASTGTDAAPYFRIFNPTTQGERFDPQGDFIRRWVPELAMIPGKAVHQPHVWAVRQRRQLAYPSPMVDHKQARVRTLAAFEAAKRAESA